MVHDPRRGLSEDGGTEASWALLPAKVAPQNRVQPWHRDLGVFGSDNFLCHKVSFFSHEPAFNQYSTLFMSGAGKLKRLDCIVELSTIPASEECRINSPPSQAQNEPLAIFPRATVFHPFSIPVLHWPLNPKNHWRLIHVPTGAPCTPSRSSREQCDRGRAGEMGK